MAQMVLNGIEWYWVASPYPVLNGIEWYWVASPYPENQVNIHSDNGSPMVKRSTK